MYITRIRNFLEYRRLSPCRSSFKFQIQSRKRITKNKGLTELELNTFELVKVALIAIVTAIISSLVTFFVSTVSNRKKMRGEFVAEINSHKEVCNQKFKSRDEKLERHSARLEHIEKISNTTSKNVSWIVGFLRNQPLPSAD
jgi:hypothetical protein